MKIFSLPFTALFKQYNLGLTITNNYNVKGSDKVIE